MTKLLEIVSLFLKEIALIGAGNASFWTTYQPEEPAELSQEK